MKLLFVSHWANNILIFRTWMLEEAVRRGHDVLVLCPNDQEAKTFESLGVRHIPWTLKRGGGVTNLLHSILQARKILREENPESTVVYCVQPIMAILCAWMLGGRSGRLYPTFTGLGSLWTDLVPPSWKKCAIRYMVERLFGYLLPLSTAVFVLNRDDKKQVTSWNSNQLVEVRKILGDSDFTEKDFSLESRSQRMKTPVIQTRGEGIDLGSFKPASLEERELARARWGIPKEAKVIGFVGRLIREKGAQDFLRMCKELQKQGYANLHFLVIGDPDQGNPQALTPREVMDLEAIPFLHRHAWMSDVRPAYAAMDVLAFLSRYREGLPVVPQEAMAMGVAVVAYDNVGTRELVPQKWFINQQDWNKLLDFEMLDSRSFVEHLSRDHVQGCFIDYIEHSSKQMGV